MKADGNTEAAAAVETGGPVTTSIVELVVGGRVTQFDAKPAAGVRVVAHWVGIGNDVKVGRGRTRGDGSYDIPVRHAVDGDRSVASGALTVAALDARGSEA